MHFKNADYEVANCIVRPSVPSKQPDDERYVIEYGDVNVYENAPGQMILEHMDNLVMSRRKAIEDYRKGLVKQYEVIRTSKRKTKCGKSRYLCQIQLRQPEGGVDRSTDSGGA